MHRLCGRSFIEDETALTAPHMDCCSRVQPVIYSICGSRKQMPERFLLHGTPRTAAKQLIAHLGLEMAEGQPYRRRYQGLEVLSRRLPSGRIINIDASDGAMFNGCT